MSHAFSAMGGRAYECPWREVIACGATCFDADVAAKVAFPEPLGACT